MEPDSTRSETNEPIYSASSAYSKQTPNPSATNSARKPSVSPINMGSVLDNPPTSESNDTISSTLPKRRSSKRRLLGIGLLLFGLIAAAVLGICAAINKRSSIDASQLPASQQIKPQDTPLTRLSSELSTTSSLLPTLTVNGRLNVSDSLVLQPSALPNSATAGQLFYDQASNQLGYYNGTHYVYLQGASTSPATTSTVTNVYNTYNTSTSNSAASSTMPTGTPGTLALYGANGVSLSDSLLSQAGSVITLGQSSSTPNAITLRSSPASGADATGSTLTIQGSNGTGGANGGDIHIQTGQAAQGGIQFDPASVGTGFIDHAVPTQNVSTAMTVGTQQNRILIVGSNYPDINSVSYDGIPLTKLDSASYADSYSDLWYLVNPPSGTFPLVVNASGGWLYSSGFGAAVYYGVDQSNPFGTPVTASGQVTGSGGATYLAVPTSNPSQVVVDSLGLDDTIVCAPLNSSGHLVWMKSQPYTAVSCGSYQAAQGTATPVSYALMVNSYANWTDVGVALNPAVPGSTPLVQVSGSNPDPMNTRLSITAAGNIGINTENPQYSLDVTGTARFRNVLNSTTAFQIQNASGASILTADTKNSIITVANLVSTGNITLGGHIITSGTVPTITASAAACTSPTVNIAGTDTSGTVTVTTGTGCASGGDLASISFANAFGATPHVILTPGDATTAALNAYFDKAATSPTGFAIGTPTTPTASTTYTWDYWTAQ